MKVLLHVPRYWPAIGGAELHSRRLAQELNSRERLGVLNHCSEDNITLAEGAALGTAGAFDDGGITVYQTGFAGPARGIMQWLGRRYQQQRFLRPFYARAFKTLQAPTIKEIVAGYDLVHSIYNGLTESTELLAALAEKLGKPFVWSPLACTEIKQGTAWSSRRFRRLYQRADALIALTEHERDWLITQGAQSDKVIVSPVGPLISEEEGVSVDGYLSDNDPVILFLARVSHAKGFDYISAAARYVWQRHPNARFVFVGPQEPQCRRYLAENRDPRLIAVEDVSQAEKSAWLKRCDLLCLPSRAESLGVVFLEAWHYRKPVVALRLPVLQQVISHGVDGLLTTHDSLAIATAINRLLENKQLANRMGLAGHAKLQRLYNWGDIGRRIESVYRGLLTRSIQLNHSHQPDGMDRTIGGNHRFSS